MTPDYLELMSRRLALEDPKLLFNALVALGEKKRRDGETALLALGDVLAEIRWQEAIRETD